MSNTYRQLTNRMLDAVIMGKLTTVEELIGQGLNPDSRDSDHNETAFMLALSFKHEDIVRFLIKHGVDVNARQNDDKTPIMYAPAFLLDLLIAQGADINAQDNNGQTLLMQTVLKADLEYVKLLITRGALVNVVDNDGKNCLDYAVDMGLLNIVQIIKQANRQDT